jgi:hypothetical protein
MTKECDKTRDVGGAAGMLGATWYCKTCGEFGDDSDEKGCKDTVEEPK